MLGFPHVVARFPEGAAQEEVFQKGRSMSLSIQVAMTKYHKLVSLKSTEISFSQLAGHPRSRYRHIWCLVRTHLLDGPLFTVTSTQCMGELALWGLFAKDINLSPEGRAFRT